MVFRNSSGDTFKFHTQFESHHPEFDFLTSLEIEEKIATMKWVPQKYHNNARMLFTANGKLFCSPILRTFEKEEEEG